MMLSTRAEDLIEKIQQLSQLKQAAQRLKDYQSRRDQLARTLDALRPPAQFIALLEKRGITVAPAPNPQLVVTAVAQAMDLSSRYKVDPSVVLGNEFGTLVKALAAAKEQLAARARASWTGFSAPDAQAVSKELLDALDRIDAFRATVRSIRACQTPIEVLAAKEWVDEHEFERFLTLVEQRTRAWEELQAGSAIPEHVVGFLKQSSTSGVRLDAVKPETIEWLRGRGIIGYFRIVL